MRKNVQPSSNKQSAKNNQPFVFETFSHGVIQDAPASEINDALSDALNLNIFPKYFEGRTGCRLYISTRFPFIPNRSGYAAHKDGRRVISDSGDIFLESDIGNYFCWGDKYEMITEYVDARTVIAETSTYRSGVDCNITGRLGVFDWHKSLRQWLILLGQEIYTAEYDIPAWNRIFPISRDLPFNAKSDWSEYKDVAYIFNGNGLYKVELAVAFPIAYKANVRPPNIRIQSIGNFTGANHKYRYLYSAARLETEGNLIDRQTPSRISLETGTCTPDENNQDWGEIHTVEAISPSTGLVVRELWVPIIVNTDPQEYEWHLSHFPIWRTMDLEAYDTADVKREEYNSPQRYIWVHDLRICAAFYASIVDNLIIAHRGLFEPADVFSIIEFDNGERYEIIEYIDEYTVRYYTDYYGPVQKGPMAAAIGNGRVIRATITGDIITRTDGGQFTAADVRQTIYDSEGYRHYITEYIDADNVRIHDSGDLPVQGFTIGATHRNFYDTVPDTTLRARKDFYSCYARYREQVPNCNLGKILPGFVVMAYRGQKEVYYSHLQSKLDYLIGQYIKTQVSEEIQDAIQMFWLFQDRMAIWCSTTTWGFAIGLSEFMTLPESGESIALLPGIKIVDRHIGCLDVGSVQEVESGVVELITNEPGGEALRQFNGLAYSEENYLVDSTMGGRITRALEKTRKLSTTIYDGFVGYVLWRRVR